MLVVRRLLRAHKGRGAAMNQAGRPGAGLKRIAETSDNIATISGSLGGLAGARMAESFQTSATQQRVVQTTPAGSAPDALVLHCPA